MNKTLISISLLGLMAAGSACGRVTMESSPEAIVAYGVPSQHSNTPSVSGKEASKDEVEVSYWGSSAIHPKPRSGQ